MDASLYHVRTDTLGPYPNHRHQVCCAKISLRLYTQLDVSSTGALSQSRQEADPSFKESGGRVDVHSITPEEVLAQANRIFAPYKLEFASPLSWFAVWKSKRVT